MKPLPKYTTVPAGALIRATIGSAPSSANFADAGAPFVAVPLKPSDAARARISPQRFSGCRDCARAGAYPPSHASCVSPPRSAPDASRRRRRWRRDSRNPPARPPPACRGPRPRQCAARPVACAARRDPPRALRHVRRRGRRAPRQSPSSRWKGSRGTAPDRGTPAWDPLSPRSANHDLSAETRPEASAANAWIRSQSSAANASFGTIQVPPQATISGTVR